MKKILITGIAIMIAGFSLNSCNDWEDENGPSDGGGIVEGPDVLMLLKEAKTNFANGTEGLSVYTYDTNNRVSKVIHHNDIEEQDSYSEVNYTYSGQNNVTSVAKTYGMGELIATTTITMTVNGDQATMVTVIDAEGTDPITTNYDITFSTPCGVDEILSSFEIPGFPEISTTTTFTYTDGNCSFEQYDDGELSQTVTNDNKFSPLMDEISYSMGIIKRNPLKIIDHFENITENVVYTYNENDYPVTASHTFTGTPGAEIDYTETFVYYD